MRIRLLILLFVGLSFEFFGQNLKIGIASIKESSFSNSVVQIDSVSVFEQTQKGDDYLMPFVKVVWPLTERFYSSLGLQFYQSFISLTAKYTSTSFPRHIPFISKGGATTTYNFEFPLGLSYLLVKKNQLRVFLELSAVPVFAIQKFTPFPVYEGLFGLDWTQEIVDVLDAVETIPEPFYVNYQYGLSAEYKRFGLTVYNAENMSQSISSDYRLYDQKYDFKRSIRSTRLGLYYSFGLKKGKG